MKRSVRLRGGHRLPHVDRASHAGSGAEAGTGPQRQGREIEQSRHLPRGLQGDREHPRAASGQTVEIEPARQTGRQRHLVPTFIYVLEGTLVTNSEGGRVGVAGAQYHAAGQSYSIGRVWHNHSNPGPGPVKYLPAVPQHARRGPHPEGRR